ncbi:MAG: redoxin domain-containing protein [Mariniphaga sp.]
MQSFILSLLLFVTAVQLSGQRVVLTGKAAGYSTKELTFYTIPDPVLHRKLELATVKIAADGTFSAALPIVHTVEIYVDLEKYCGTMVVEPGKNYRIVLPPFSLRTADEAHSAYFKAAPFWLGMPGADNSDINFTVRSFITDYNLETVKNTDAIYRQKSKEIVAQIQDRLDKKYSSNQNEYFRILKRYYFAELEYAVNQNTPEFVIQKYFINKPVQLTHPIYQRAFEALFTDFLRKQSQNIQNRKIINLTNSGNYTDLVRFFTNKGYQEEFAELVVLKGLYDGFYTGSFLKQGIIRAVETSQTAVLSPDLQLITQEIKSKLTLLSVGSKAPAIKLYNLNNELITLDQFGGKYVYLSFFKSTSSDCKTELDSIVSIEKRLKQVLYCVSVSLDADFSNASKLWTSKKYPWELLNGTRQKQLIINYNASISPVFYLIAPDGTLQLSPAPSPSQGFEPLFLKLLRASNFRRQRN